MEKEFIAKQNIPQKHIDNHGFSQDSAANFYTNSIQTMFVPLS